jgi:transposase
MGTPQKEPLRPVTQQEQAALEGIAKASSERVDRVRRARALLAVAQGQPFVQAAQTAGLRSGSTVAGLVQRFNAHGLTALAIAAGRGRMPTYNATARAQIVATAQTTPDRKKDGTATWSLSTLQKRLRKDGLEHIGANTVKRVLEDAGSSYQKTRSWCPTGTAQRKRKSGVVTVIDPETEAKRG